jgi:hypothetical protein
MNFLCLLALSHGATYCRSRSFFVPESLVVAKVIYTAMPRLFCSSALSLVLTLGLALAGCQRDPGRDVKPMTRTTESGTPPSTEIIPLDKVSKSQPAIVGQRIANTDITITYSRPVARGRQLFGGIVPFDEAWDPGADQATSLTFSRDVQVNGHPLPAGKYSFWVIPRTTPWTVIFSKDGNAYHTPYPGEAKDALRFDVSTRSGPHAETLTYDFPIVEGKDAELDMRWGSIVLPLSLKVP